MKLGKGLIILLSVFLILVLAYIFLIDKDEADDGYEDTEEKIIDIKINDVKTVTVKNGDVTYIVGREKEDEDVWVLISPEGLDYDSSEVRSIVYNAYSVSANRVIDENAADLSQYGFDNPVVVTVLTNNDEEHVFEIGNTTSTGNDRYAKLSGSSKVYTIGSYSAGKLVFNKDSIRSKVLFTSASDEITKLNFTKAGNKVFEANKQEDEGWKLTYPISAGANETAIADMLNAIDGINIEEFIGSGEALISEYGLDKPDYVLEFEATSENGTLMLGDESDGYFYATKAGNDEVFKLSAGYFGFLDKPLKEIVTNFVYLINIDELSGIDIQMDGYALDIVMETGNENTDEDRFYINGQDASMTDEYNVQPFRHYYEALVGISQSDILPEAKPQGPPEITITYKLKSDPDEMKLEFITKDENYYYVNKNGEYSGLLVKKSDFDKKDGIRQEYAELMEFINSYEPKE